MGRLREVIREHVASPGLEVLAADARCDARELQRAFQRLAERVGPAATAAVSAEPLRKAVRDLAKAYDEMKDQVRKGTQELSVERDGAMVSVSELVQDELKAVVRDWPIWAALFECVEDGRIVVRDGEEVYQNQDEFLAPYLEAVKTLEAFVQKAIRDAIPATLDAIAVKASSAGASLAPFLGTAARKRIEEKHGPKVTGLYDRLCDAAEPARLAAKVLDDPAPAAPPGAASAVPATGKADTAEPHPGASDDAGLLRAILEGRPALPDARSQFPLALEKTFSWSRSKPCRQPGADHQSTIRVLQDAFVGSLEQAFLQVTRRIDKIVSERMLGASATSTPTWAW